jgi:hypothetical protein
MGLRPNLEIQREVRTTILGVQAEIKKTEQQKNNWAQNKVWPKSFLQTGPGLGRIRPNRIIHQPSWECGEKQRARARRPHGQPRAATCPLLSSSSQNNQNRDGNGDKTVAIAGECIYHLRSLKQTSG